METARVLKFGTQEASHRRPRRSAIDILVDECGQIAVFSRRFWAVCCDASGAA
jgi:hypothetical protein